MTNKQVVGMPWAVAVTVLKHQLMMAWMSQGKSLDEAKTLFGQLKTIEPDEELYGLVEQLVDKITTNQIRQ